MSAVKGVNKTIQDAVTPATLLAPEVIGSKEHVIYDEYEAAGLEAASTITLPEVPLGAMITDWIIDHDALGSSVTLKFGTVASDAVFMAAAASASAGKKYYQSNGVAASLGYRCDSATKCQPVITTAGAAATGTIKVMIKYTTKN